MWVSRRTDYATRAILALAIEDGGPIKLEALARRRGAPVRPRAGDADDADRGPRPLGARAFRGLPPEQAPRGDHARARRSAVPGPLAPISCATRHNPEPCPMMLGCTLRDVWAEVRDATITLLGGVTFADLAARAGGAWVDPSLIVPVENPATAGRPDRQGRLRARLRDHETRGTPR